MTGPHVAKRSSKPADRALLMHSVGPGVTVQDLGRPGYLALGLSRGGAADRLALYEGAALLGQAPDHAALEMAGMGGVFEATADIRIALTGAPMRASLAGAPLLWNASHSLPAGARLKIDGVEAGTYGYLSFGGGLAEPAFLGQQSVHLAAGIGRPLKAGDQLAIAADTGSATNLKLAPDNRFTGGTLRLVPSLQTDLFSTEDIARFEATVFTRDVRGNRMGVRLMSNGPGFGQTANLSVVSEVVVPGDVQITGDGTPFVLMSECQTTGGYPRIGSVLPSDLPRVAQAQPGAQLRFAFVSLEAALEIEQKDKARRGALKKSVAPLIRDPKEIANLRAYQLIGGVTAGDDLERHLP